MVSALFVAMLATLLWMSSRDDEVTLAGGDQSRCISCGGCGECARSSAITTKGWAAGTARTDCAAISLLAQMLGIVDVFDALRTERP
jgi:hypothetical protein